MLLHVLNLLLSIVLPPSFISTASGALVVGGVSDIVCMYVVVVVVVVVVCFLINPLKGYHMTCVFMRKNLFSLDIITKKGINATIPVYIICV